MTTDSPHRPDPASDDGAPGEAARRNRGPRRGRAARGGPDARGGGDQRGGHARRARAAAARTAAVVPPIHYPPELPVSARREDIAAAIRDHQVVVVAGETGSGKTTQLPKILLDLGRGRAGQIGHTQPRRIAARSVAERIAQEIGTPLGELVGYQVRFTDTSSEHTLVKVMTDGILLAAIQRDPELLAYDTLVIDEAHERSLNIDFLLGYLTRLLPRRPDLKVVITSATIDSARFARHFATPPTADRPEGVPAPVVEVTGRTYPVEIRYRPLSPDALGVDDEDDEGTGTDGATGRPARRPRTPARQPVRERDLMTGITEAVDELCAEGPGDVLVFLSGEREIRDAEDALRASLGTRATDPRHPQHVELLPLFSRLSAAEQHRVFSSHPGRRVVLATNVAETSLTVPGIRYVVDPGTARISRWSKATKVQRLPIEPISQASANQRSGRCGRVADGIAIRLYSQDDFERRDRFTEPEILRTSLASVILQMIAVGVAATPEDVVGFPFVDPPDVRAVRDGVQLLTELGAIESGAQGTRLTETGRAIAQLPVDPRLARMVVEAARHGVLREVVVVAAALSIQDPRERPAEERDKADAMHARFADPSSDLLAYLNLWTYLREQQRELSGSAFRRTCRSEHLNYLRVREWQDVVTQLKDLSKHLPGAERRTGGDGAPALAETAPDEPAGGPRRGELRREWDADAVHRSVLAGLLSHVGMQEATEVAAPRKGDRRPQGRPDRRGRNEYLGARGARFAIFPGSGLARKPPAWVMAAELVETSRLWARDTARIDPAWAEELGAHLVKRTYSEPAWSTKQGAATCTERVLLYGLPVVAGRRVLYAAVDPGHARELFLRHALVQGEWTTHHQFFHENRRLLAEAEELAARARRADLLADEDTLYDFYDERVPDDVVSARHFDQWWKTARRRDPDLLSFDRALLVADDAHAIDESSFPSRWPQGDLSLPLTYQFEPGTEADGVTVHIPLAQLPRVTPDGFGWMVPGLLDELVVATIRSLPKPVRVQLVPAPDVGRAVAERLRAQSASWEDTVRAGDAAPSFHEAFARAVRELRDVEVPQDAFDDERLPAHLRLTFRVVGDRGGVVDEGRDLAALQHRLADRAQDAVDTAVRSALRQAMREAGLTSDEPARPGPGAGGRPARGTASAPSSDPVPSASPEHTATPGPTPGPAPGLAEQVTRTGLTTWPDDLTLPEVVEVRTGATLVRAYPSLVQERDRTVAVRTLADGSARPAAARAGLRRLLLIDGGLAPARVTSRWSGAQALALAANPYPSRDALVEDVQLAAVDALVAEHLRTRPADAGRTPADVRTPADYAALRAYLRDRLEDRVHTLVGTLVQVLTAWRELEVDLRGTTSLPLLATAADVREQSARLVHAGFVVETGADRLHHLTRYLRAARHRLERAAQGPQRDADLAWQVHDLENALASAPGADPEQVAQVRWQLEELRVSLFAQQLGTPTPVSPQRIRKALATL
ncbi:ATP-dependent RNA helicase HrpA [Cellulomonas sp. DKR-3]|uniref:ATP-dependent RNA helicase HrpA n=1 Tax=Cellulomonas fulva TaxID=2835530 RepID=A0ABS5TW76_9CELL|nr:ATP-dependent RNA helicase HrpA [Cellulomonas fulva]MBT0993391.1 ATP-dependent RNA helicase HrpA [Cellulomonas fulva]